MERRQVAVVCADAQWFASSLFVFRPGGAPCMVGEVLLESDGWSFLLFRPGAAPCMVGKVLLESDGWSFLLFLPGGAIENSPAIYRWVAGYRKQLVP